VRVLFISKEGDGLGVGQRVAFEGHNVDFYIADAGSAKAGRGIVNRVAEWRPALRRADLIIADCVGLGRYENIVREAGRPMIGFNRALDAAEIDRRAGMDLFTNVGVQTPETLFFDSKKEALSLPSRHGWDSGWVVKCSGNLSNDKTAVVKEETLWPRAIECLPDPCSGVVQRIVSGVEISTEGWFNGSKFVRPFNHTFEDKRFLAGDLGQNTGCMGNVVLRADSKRLTKATVERVEPFLKVIGYRGPFDINCIVNESGAYALEATSRMGFDAIEAFAEGLEEPLGDFLFDVATGTKREMALTGDTMIAVRLSIPPWPIRAPNKTDAGAPVGGIDEDTLHHLFLCDMEKHNGSYVTAGCDGVLLKATAVGSIRPARLAAHNPDYTYEARRRVYRLLDKISVSNKQYRVDIGTRVNDDIAQLKKWGWL
jgi:phosphoribosylamine---glycine ligase